MKGGMHEKWGMCCKEGACMVKGVCVTKGGMHARRQVPIFSYFSQHNPIFPIFRWFKFTLKPPYSIALDNLRLAI